MTNVDKFIDMVQHSDNIVFFGGAGVSTESGIPDFRSVDGLYNQKYKYPPETILSHSFYVSQPEEFYRFYRDKMLCLDAQPNAAHIKLAELEKAGKLKAIVTQNIDGLHQKAGSKNVLELHGSVHRNFCQRCHKFFDAEYMLHSDGVPKCDACSQAKGGAPHALTPHKFPDAESRVRWRRRAEVMPGGVFRLRDVVSYEEGDWTTTSSNKTCIISYADMPS